MTHELTIQYVREGATQLPLMWQTGFDDDGPCDITESGIGLLCTWCGVGPSSTDDETSEVGDTLYPVLGEHSLYWMHTRCRDSWNGTQQLVCDACHTPAMRHNEAIRTTTMYVGPFAIRCALCVPPQVEPMLCPHGHLVTARSRTNVCEACGLETVIIPCSTCDNVRSYSSVCDTCRPCVITEGTLPYHIPDHSEIPWYTEFPVGIEIEAEYGVRAKLNKLVFESTQTGVGGDASLPSATGVEARLAPLNGDRLQMTLTAICGQLTKAGYKPTQSAGVHGHVWAGPLRQEDVGSIILYASAFDDVIHGMMPPSRNGNEYAMPIRPIGKDVTKMVEEGSTLSAASIGVLQHSSRYLHVNTNPYWSGHPSHRSETGDGGNKTIEWRLHSASLNPTKIHNWARIIRGMTMHAGQFKVDADEWAAEPLSPEKVGAFLKGIEQDDLFDYVMQRVIKFEKITPHCGSQLELTYDIVKMSGSKIWTAGKELIIEESEVGGDLINDNDCEHNWYNDTCENCGRICDHENDYETADCGEGCQTCYDCYSIFQVSDNCTQHN